MKVFKRQSLFNSFFYFFAFSENVKNSFAILHRLFSNEEVTFYHFLCLFAMQKNLFGVSSCSIFPDKGQRVRGNSSDIAPYMKRHIQPLLQECLCRQSFLPFLRLPDRCL